MQQFLGASLFGVALLLAPTRALADSFEFFHLDPTRSSMSVQWGDIGILLSTTDFAYSTLTPQPGADPAPLSGHFVMQILNDTTNPSFFIILPGSTDIRPTDSNLLEPGVGGAPGSVNAAFGVSFADPVAGISGKIAIHDLIFGISGGFSPFANSLGPFGFFGDLNWSLASGVMEIQTDIGLGGTVFTPFVIGGGFADALQSQFSEVSPGVFEVLMPFQFTISVNGLPGPFSNTGATIIFAGQIVATNRVPEPGAGVLLALGLTIVAARRRERSPR